MADHNINLGTPASPCKDCKKRFVGCHDSTKCKKWAAYVEAKKAVAAKRSEASWKSFDDRKHNARHGSTWHLYKDKDR